MSRIFQHDRHGDYRVFHRRTCDEKRVGLIALRIFGTPGFTPDRDTRYRGPSAGTARQDDARKRFVHGGNR